jgi:hypothetical protein
MKFQLPKLSRETIIAILLFFFIIVVSLASAVPTRPVIYQGF